MDLGLVGYLMHQLTRCVDDVFSESVRREAMRQVNMCLATMTSRGELPVMEALIQEEGFITLLVRSIDYYNNNFNLSEDLLGRDAEGDGGGVDDRRNPEEKEEEDDVKGSDVDIVLALSRMASSGCSNECLGILAEDGVEKVLVDFIISYTEVYACGGNASEEDRDVVRGFLFESMTALKCMMEFNHNGAYTALRLAQDVDLVESIGLEDDEVLGPVAIDLIETIAFGSSLQDAATEVFFDLSLSLSLHKT